MATAKTGDGDLATEVEPAPTDTPAAAEAPATTEDTSPQPTPPQYGTGWVKQDPATMAVAVRTNIPDPYFDHEWGVMTVDRGGHYASWDEVSGWLDRT